MAPNPTTSGPGAKEHPYRRGDRVELTEVPPDYLRFAIAAGERGTVDLVDALGTVHVKWDNGQRCGVIAEAAHIIREISEAAAGEPRWISANSGPDFRVPDRPGEGMTPA
jgi:hypothetical protein